MKEEDFPMEKAAYKKFEKIVGKEHLSDSLEQRICYSYDATKQKALPSVIIRPKSTQEVKEIMTLACGEGIPVYPRGAGSGLSGGCVPVKGGLVLEMTRMSSILQIDEANLMAEVEPGCVVADLQRAVEKRGLFYPPDPASNEFSTIGGNVAECSGGLRAVKYGVTRDYVLALEIVLASGEVIHTGSRTLKSVAGYDLVRLFVGSEGTLGVFTRILLRLIPLPQSIATLLCFFETDQEAARTVEALVRERILPRTLEFIEKEVIACVQSYRGSAFDEEKGAALLIEVDGEESSVVFQALRIKDICKEMGALRIREATLAYERDALWTVRRAISPALCSMAPGKINEDICVPPSSLSEMLERISHISKKYSLKILNFGHAGDGNIHSNIMIDGAHEEERQRAEEAVTEIFQETLSLRGTLSAEHGIGLTKAKYLPMEIRETELRLMRQIKALFDPKGILNPGKVFYDG